MSAASRARSALRIRPRAFRCALAEVLGKGLSLSALKKRAFPDYIFFGILRLWAGRSKPLMKPLMRRSPPCPKTCGRGWRASQSSSRKKGLERVGEPHVKHIEGCIWEMRLKGRSGISRALYVTAVGRRVVIVRVFVKKTEKTPRREVELALTRAKSVS